MIVLETFQQHDVHTCVLCKNDIIEFEALFEMQ